MIVLESKRLFFRDHEVADLDSYCAMEMDADVRRYVGGYPRSREDAERKFRDGALRSFSDRSVSDRLGVWAAVLKPDGPYAGRCGLYPRISSGGEIVAGEAALAFYIAHPFWGRGFATEAAFAFVNFGWEELHLKRIVATVQLGNNASVHILQKLGFELIATEQGTRTFLKFVLCNPSANETR